MEIIKEKTVAFTGNRTLKTSTGRPDTNLENVLRTELSFCLEECYNEGKRNYITGMAIGWDMLCAEEVLKFKAKHSDVKLIAAIPFQGQELMYGQRDKDRYKIIYEAADHIEYITEGGYDNNAYHKRNDWMIANACEIMAYDSHQPRSGTASTVRKAKLNGLEVLNFFDELEDYFQNNSPAKKCLQSYSHIESVKFGREGLIFEGYNRPHPLPFENIVSVEQKCEFLEISLQNGIVYKASLFGNECFVSGI